MWNVSLERHNIDSLELRFNFSTEKLFLAWLVYAWASFVYLMTDYPVKKLSLYHSKNGIISFKGMKSKSQNWHIAEEMKSPFRRQKW